MERARATGPERVRLHSSQILGALVGVALTASVIRNEGQRAGDQAYEFGMRGFQPAARVGGARVRRKSAWARSRDFARR